VIASQAKGCKLGETRHGVLQGARIQEPIGNSQKPGAASMAIAQRMSEQEYERFVMSGAEGAWELGSWPAHLSARAATAASA
jgi:hypothetical protein